MVRDIYERVSKEYDCYLLSSNYNLREEDVSNSLHILNSKSGFRFAFIRPLDIITACIKGKFDYKEVKRLVKANAHLRRRINIFLFYLHRIKPDIVNFHEFDDLNTVLVKICMERGVKCIITNHLYIGDAPGCEAYEYLKHNERILLNIPNLQISTISTGMKKRMVHDYPKLNPNCIHITIDGTRFAQGTDEETEKFFRHGKYIYLCIGNVMRRKNQKQLIRAISALDAEFRNCIEVWFLGTDRNNDVNRWIAEYKCNDVAFYKGKVRSEQMSGYYKNAYATITTSYCEGFGLTMIEGYSYGIPAILPIDIDSYDDIYDDNCAIAIKGRTDNDILDAIIACMNKKWNANTIRNKARDFNMDRVGNDYIQMYNRIIKL